MQASSFDSSLDTSPDLTEEYYENKDFNGTDFEDKTLTKIKFVNCRFPGVSFCDSELNNCTFEKCRFSNVKFNSAQIKSCAFLICEFPYSTFFGASLIKCKMSGSSLYNSDITCMEIKGGDWSYTDLRELEFYKMDFFDINFEYADLMGAKIEKSTISHCNLTHAITSNLSLYGSDIRTSNISGIDILGMNFKDTTIDLEQAVVISAALGAKFVP